MMPSLTHIAYTEWISPKKSCVAFSWISFLIFLCLCFVEESTNFIFCNYINALLLPYLRGHSAEFDKLVHSLTMFDLKI